MARISRSILATIQMARNLPNFFPCFGEGLSIYLHFLLLVWTLRLQISFVLTCGAADMLYASFVVRYGRLPLWKNNCYPAQSNTKKAMIQFGRASEV